MAVRTGLAGSKDLNDALLAAAAFRPLVSRSTPPGTVRSGPGHANVEVAALVAADVERRTEEVARGGEEVRGADDPAFHAVFVLGRDERGVGRPGQFVTRRNPVEHSRPADIFALLEQQIAKLETDCLADIEPACVALCGECQCGHRRRRERRFGEAAEHAGHEVLPQFVDLLGDEAGIERFAVDDLERPRAHPQTHITATGLGARLHEATQADVRERTGDIRPHLDDFRCMSLSNRFGSCHASNDGAARRDRTGRTAASERDLRHQRALDALRSVGGEDVAARRSRTVAGSGPARPSSSDERISVRRLLLSATVSGGLAIAFITVHDGTIGGRSARLLLVVLAAALVGYATECGSDGVRGWSAILAGTIVAAVGAGIAGPHLAKTGLTPLAIAGAVALLAGVVLVVGGSTILVRARRGWRRFAVVPLVLVFVYVCVWTLVQAVAATNVPHMPMAIAAGSSTRRPRTSRSRRGIT